LLHERLSGTDIKIVACIHDEIILETPEDETDVAEHVLRNAMIRQAKCISKMFRLGLM
jgi:DNA polymerase I-like protein with 3'-5' exonuclease and polymerase domains